MVIKLKDGKWTEHIGPMSLSGAIAYIYPLSDGKVCRWDGTYGSRTFDTLDQAKNA